jgi:hypothetical protein
MIVPTTAAVEDLVAYSDRVLGRLRAATADDHQYFLDLIELIFSDILDTKSGVSSDRLSIENRAVLAAFMASNEGARLLVASERADVLVTRAYGKVFLIEEVEFGCRAIH